MMLEWTHWCLLSQMHLRPQSWLHLERQTHPLPSAVACNNQLKKLKKCCRYKYEDVASQVHLKLILVVWGQILRLILAIAFHGYCASNVGVWRWKRQWNFSFLFLGVCRSCRGERDIGLFLLHDLLQCTGSCTSFKTAIYTNINTTWGKLGGGGKSFFKIINSDFNNIVSHNKNCTQINGLNFLLLDEEVHRKRNF